VAAGVSKSGLTIRIFSVESGWVTRYTPQLIPGKHFFVKNHSNFLNFPQYPGRSRSHVSVEVRIDNQDNNLVCPPGVKFAPTGELGPRGELCSLGRMLTPSFTPRGKHSIVFGRMEGQTENFREFAHGGTTSPLGVKVCP
jgi:hypothetical protein